MVFNHENFLHIKKTRYSVAYLMTGNGNLLKHAQNITGAGL